MRRVVRVAVWELDAMSEAKEVIEAKARVSERQQKMLRDGWRAVPSCGAQESVAPAAETVTKREGKSKGASA